MAHRTPSDPKRPTLTFSLLFSLAFAQPTPSTLIDRVEVVISDQPLTRSDILLEAELARRIPSPNKALRDVQQRDPTQALIEQTLIRRLAAQVALYQPTTEAVRERLAALRASFPTPGDLDRFQQQHGLDREMLIDLLIVRLSVEQYVHRNIDLSSLSAREDDDAYFTRYRDWMDVLIMTSDIRYVEHGP